MSGSTDFILDFIRHLLSATANASLFGMEHPQVARLTTQAFDSLLKALAERQEFTLVIIENELVIDGQPQDFSLFLDRFVRILSARGIGHIRLTQGITRDEIMEFIAAMARQGAEATRAVSSSEHFRLGRVDIRSNGRTSAASDTSGDSGASFASIGSDGVDETDGSGGSAGFGKAGDSRKSAPIPIADMPAEEMARLMEIYETVKHRHKLKITGIFEIVSDFIDTFRREGRALLVMAALRETDAYTFTHSTNVCILNIAQAMSLGIEGQLLNDIGVAGMLHDIGKLFIPEEILTKPGKLTEEEFSLMQTHPARGARYLLESPGVPRLAIVNAFEHHLKYDLSGYPKVPAAWNQNICSHMTTISDFYDAMRTRRSYSEAQEQGEILCVMRKIVGTHLHPGLTLHFLRLISNLKGL